MNPDDDFGVGIASGHDNIVEENHGVGNTNGVILFPGVTGNIVRGNLFVGNPPAQVSDTFPTHNGVDIDNRATPGANTIENNQCVTSRNAPCTIPVDPSAKGKKKGHTKND